MALQGRDFAWFIMCLVDNPDIDSLDNPHLQAVQHHMQSVVLCYMQVPLDISVRINSDAGNPVTLTDPESPCTQAYVHMAEALQRKLATMGSTPQSGPKIVVE